MFVFAHIPKTAGTSFKYILRNSFGAAHCDVFRAKAWPFTKEHLDEARKIFFDLKCVSGHNLIEPTRHLGEPDLYYITFLREPLKRCASMYQDDCVRGNNKKPFEEWIRTERLQNMQVKQIAGEPDVEKAKQLLRDQYFFTGITERFEESLKLLKVLSPYPLNLKYKYKLQGSNNTIKENLLQDPGQRKLLEDTNNLDMELYEYAENQLFPEHLKMHEEAIKRVSLPQTYYKTHFTFRYQMSILFNKFVYRRIIKYRNRKQGKNGKR